ncbi:uncharacterized protein LAJ45_11610 [Morchella importuna]|uniref:uncharacterized protein n=1 Tax=Morchella importuna TaxID=1174673 RepID=UPI001E8D9782|nr:uncharacterized protein LAJ45_11610 [Morchella importuna]KAH8144410.1 hypothetical protein LAJ45_11610 [Morchella importuna]
MASSASSSTERIRPVAPQEGSPAQAIYTSGIIDEGSCLLRDYSLPTIPEKEDGGVVFLRYSLGRWHTVRIERGDMNDDDDDEVVVDEDEDTFRIVPLKDLYIADTMVIRSANFPPGEADGIRVVKFTECSVKIVQDFLKAISEFMRIPDSTLIPAPGSQDPQPLLDSPNLTKYESYVPGKDFVTGVSLRASFRPRKYLTLFAAFPYLGLGTANGTGSLSLRQYRYLGTASPDVDVGDSRKRILVNQGWFFIFDNSNIAMFTSADEDSAPLFPYQRRLGGFHLLVHMIANILTSYETSPLREFRKKVARQELHIQSQLAKDILTPEKSIKSTHTTAELEAEQRITEDLIEAFEESLADIAIMKDVVQSQIQILEDLREIFQNSFKFEKGVGRPRNHRNAVKIPYIMDGKEQMRKAVVTVDAVIRERKEFKEELSVWLKDLRKSKILTSHDSQTVTAKEALKQGEMMQKAITQQGQTISVFTLITTIFVPLGFFTSYFGMSLSDWKSSITTPADFWAIAGPVTFLIMLLMSYFLYGPDDWIKDGLASSFRWTTRVWRLWRQPKGPKAKTPRTLESAPGPSPGWNRLSSNRFSSMSGMGLEKAAGPEES